MIVSFRVLERTIFVIVAVYLYLSQFAELSITKE